MKKFNAKNLAIIIFFGILLVLVETGCVGGIPDRDSGSTFVETIPTSDITGEEISDIPRYPDSTRITYEENFPTQGYIMVVYVTSDGIDPVLDFYKAQLPAHGWSYISKTTDQVSATKESQDPGVISILMTVTADDSDDYPGYTEISIGRGSVFTD